MNKVSAYQCTIVRAAVNGAVHDTTIAAVSRAVYLPVDFTVFWQVFHVVRSALYDEVTQ